MLFIAIPLLGIDIESVSASAWHIETVDSAGDVGYCTSIGLDPITGYPRISYGDGPNGDLKYASYDGSTWKTEIVDSAGDVGDYTSLSLDPTTGYPRISYTSTNHDLKYASYDGSTWNTEAVDSAGVVGDTSLALDPTTGCPRISYTSTNHDLKYASYDGSTWNTKIVDYPGSPDQGWIGFYSSLALDPKTGYPRISYSDSTNHDLKYASYDGSTWNTEIVDSQGLVLGLYSSLALDPKTGYPRISYHDSPNSDLKYASYDGSTWKTETVDSAGAVGMYTSLALDPKTGYPRISYQDGPNSDLKYASYDGSTWHTEIVDSAGYLGMYTSLALDPITGYPHISYLDISNVDLKYASLLLPLVTGITVPIDPVPVNSVVSVNGTFTDPDTADPHIAVWNWGDSTTSDGTVTESDGTVTGSHTYTAPGVYTVSLTVTDSLGISNTNTAQTYVVIYDPTGGFVTGGGWINSPSGAYLENPTLTGKADFGFVSKYKKGATVPEGNTLFKFNVADLKFESTSYKWLVVNQAGTNAQFFGQGTINGGLAPNNQEYKFMIWATDGNPDTFRIKIWWEDNSAENVIYNNNMEQPIGGGAIQVHAK